MRVRELTRTPLDLIIYPALFSLAGMIHATMILHGLLDSWSQTVRDKEFLTEMRLQNLEPEPERKMASQR